MANIIIAIDGYSSTGKSTMAKRLAEALRYVYVDTGAMYRAVTLFALRNSWVGEGVLCKKELVNALENIDLKFRRDGQSGMNRMHLNGEDVEDEIRGLQVSGFVSQIAALPEIRQFLVQQQQVMGVDKGIVMDGRDIGSVVFPEAELKLFITASPEVRAQRRYDEMKAKGEEVSYDEVLENLTKRDAMDVSRAVSPLVKAQDAIEIDNSHMTREEQFEKILKLAKSRIEATK